MEKRRPGAVVDCSITLSWFFNDEKSRLADSILHKLDRITLWVPAIWTLEFANALINARRRKRISEKEHVAILDHAARLPLIADAEIHSLSGITGLAQRYGLTSYDAAYLELALRKDLLLATLDEALAKAAVEAGVTLLT
ncbi:MAG: type II toxin-antitoxin system VapC family toxin [Nitrospinae bacterium]|nr:type II toxin-antitoxin system VapC family toxin [Nitrospinota bacterium]